jgi:2-hydroxychromene-2-carboxylate isomerase
MPGISASSGKSESPMTLTADLFFSFRSPYSYLAIGRYRRMCEEYDLDITLRTVLPIAVRDPDILFTGNPAAPRYIMLDCMRAAQFLGIPLRWPRPDPIVQDFATGEIAKEQPYIHRICRLGQTATRRGKGLVFAAEVAPLIWDGSAEGWHEGDHLAGAAARAGLDFAALEAEAAEDASALDAELAANMAALDAAGHWGVPTLVFEGEPFFGQDRIAMAQWRMEQKGLVKRC